MEKREHGVTTPENGAVPSPYEIGAPPGCEGWQEMYPDHVRFDERRCEQDDGRLWFWDSNHFPLPMPAFEVVAIDVPYQVVDSWQKRVFAVPPAIDIDHRCVNGYIYVSESPVTDPAKVAERAAFFQERAGHYVAGWDELYGEWRARMTVLLAELGAVKVPEPPEVGDTYARLVRLHDLVWQHHFEFALLGYGAYATLLESDRSRRDLVALCRTVFPCLEEHRLSYKPGFLTSWRTKIRDVGALLERHGLLADREDVFHLSWYEVASALDELPLTWASGRRRVGPSRWRAIVARRKDLLSRLSAWTPPPALGVVPDVMTDRRHDVAGRAAAA